MGRTVEWAGQWDPKQRNPLASLRNSHCICRVDGPSTGWGFHGFHAANCWFWGCLAADAAFRTLQKPNWLCRVMEVQPLVSKAAGARHVRQPTPHAGWQRALTLPVSQLNLPISLLMDDCCILQQQISLSFSLGILEHQIDFAIPTGNPTVGLVDKVSSHPSNGGCLSEFGCLALIAELRGFKVCCTPLPLRQARALICASCRNKPKTPHGPACACWFEPWPPVVSVGMDSPRRDNCHREGSSRAHSMRVNSQTLLCIHSPTSPR